MSSFRAITAVDDALSARLLVDSCDAFVLDCDGVLWSGAEGLLPEVAETLAFLRAMGKRCVFVTNNASKSRAQLKAKFAALGLNVDLSQIVPASYVAARLCRVGNKLKTEIVTQRGPSSQARWLAGRGAKRAFVVGEEGLASFFPAPPRTRASLSRAARSSPTFQNRKAQVAELEAQGVSAVRPVRGGLFDERSFASAQPERVDAVLVGHDAGFDMQAIVTFTVAFSTIRFADVGNAILSFPRVVSCRVVERD